MIEGIEYCPALEVWVETGVRRPRSLGGAVVSWECEKTGSSIKTRDTPTDEKAKQMADREVTGSGLCIGCEIGEMTPEQYEVYKARSDKTILDIPE